MLHRKTVSSFIAQTSNIHKLDRYSFANHSFDHMRTFYARASVFEDILIIIWMPSHWTISQAEQMCDSIVIMAQDVLRYWNFNSVAKS